MSKSIRLPILMALACLSFSAGAAQSFFVDSAKDNIYKGNINVSTDTFKCMLVTAAPNMGTAQYRSDLTEATGTGYTAGGVTVTVTTAKDTTNHKQTTTAGICNFGSTTTISGAVGAVVYKSRGGAATADEILFYNGFGATYSSSAGAFTVAASTIAETTPVSAN